MDKVEVESAKKMAKDHNAVGCIVICIGHDRRMNLASYGTNKHNCGQMGSILNSIGVAYDQGYLGVPDFKEGPRSPFPSQETKNER